MPDLITHVALSHFFVRGYELKKKTVNNWPWRLLFYFGTILPDILTRPFYILFALKNNWTVGLHTPLATLAVCGIIALFFAQPLRKKVFHFLAAGNLAHFLLDSFQKHLIPQSYWLLPFSWRNYHWGFLYPNQFMSLIPLWLGLVVVFEVVVYLITRQSRKDALS